MTPQLLARCSSSMMGDLERGSTGSREHSTSSKEVSRSALPKAIDARLNASAWSLVVDRGGTLLRSQLRVAGQEGIEF